MAKIAFGRQHYDPSNTVFNSVTQALIELPRRHRSCVAQIVMRGCSAAWEEWIVLEVSRASAEDAQACIDWVSKQVTRQGFAIVPLDRL
jgi:hypothetical protein